MKLRWKCLAVAALVACCVACAQRHSSGSLLNVGNMDKQLKDRLAKFMKNNPSCNNPGEEKMAEWDPNIALLKLDGPLKQRFSSILKETETVKPGMTRGDLLKLFRTEGGIYTRTRCEYGYRTCSYLKVDVIFQPVGELKAGESESAADVIKVVSKPYVQWVVID